VVVIPKVTDEPNVEVYGEEQRKNMKSMLIYQFCLAMPRAIVITANQEKLFREDDDELIELIHAVGIALRGELNLKALLGV